MTFDYSAIAATATAQIADKGRDVQIVYKTEGTYSPTTDAITGESEDTVTVRALVTNFNKRDVAAGLVEANDLQVMIAAAGITKPKTGDKVLDGEEFRVVTVTEIKPGGTAILYKLQVRKG